MTDADRMLVEPWESLPRQREAGIFGMWAFLASEVMFFGALILTYTVYRSLYPDAFASASHETNIFYGSVNTGILITSSLIMTMAVHASELKMKRLLVFCLILTACFGFGFLAVKSLEYIDDLNKHLLPYAGFRLDAPPARLFFACYWIMTGIHAMHLTIGCFIVLALAYAVATDRIQPNSSKVSPVSLYWHFVDTVWLILYALIYLPGRP